MSKLQTIENDVLIILMTKPETREDDYLLMLEVCKLRNFDRMNYPFWEVIQDHAFNGLPNWKSIERARRKLQRKYPDLQSLKAVNKRAIEEEEYIEYSRT